MLDHANKPSWRKGLKELSDRIIDTNFKEISKTIEWEKLFITFSDGSELRWGIDHRGSGIWITNKPHLKHIY